MNALGGKVNLNLERTMEAMPLNMDNIEWIWQLYGERPDTETGILALCLLFAEMEDTGAEPSAPITGSTMLDKLHTVSGKDNLRKAFSQRHS
jgi:hypothetical protein